PVATKHRLDALWQLAGSCQFKEQAQGFIVDALLGVIQIQANRLDAEALTPRRVGGEQVAQMLWTQGLSMVQQGVPLGALSQGRGSWVLHWQASAVQPRMASLSLISTVPTADGAGDLQQDPETWVPKTDERMNSRFALTGVHV